MSPTQPPPIPATGDVWAELIAAESEPVLRALFEARRAFGVTKYGTPLQRGNGRDHVADLREELLDGIAYATAANMQQEALELRVILSRMLR